MHGQEVNVENAVRLLIRCKHLLKGRRILAQAMMIIVERNRQMNTLKAAVAQDKAGNENMPTTEDENDDTSADPSSDSNHRRVDLRVQRPYWEDLAKARETDGCGAGEYAFDEEHVKQTA